MLAVAELLDWPVPLEFHSKKLSSTLVVIVTWRSPTPAAPWGSVKLVDRLRESLGAIGPPPEADGSYRVLWFRSVWPVVVLNTTT